jgi:hypothetical protein
MTLRLFGLWRAVAAVALLAACTEDPTANLVGSPFRLVLNFDSLIVNIADSTTVTGRVLDEAGNPLVEAVSMASCDQNVATVSPASDAPLVQTSYFVKGITFGGTCVNATAGSLTDVVRIATFPATIAVTSGPDTLLSGTIGQYTFEYRDAKGNPVAGVPDPVFETNAATVATILAAPLGAVQAKSPGAATITVRGHGPFTGGITSTKSVLVIPGVFGGTLSAAAAVPGDIVNVTRAVGGPAFDADTRVFVRGVRTFTHGTTTADSLKFVMPQTAATGLVSFLVDQIGPDQIALADSSKLSSTTASLDGPNEPANNNPATAPAIAANGDYYQGNHGVCTNGVATAPGDDCDGFFRITNSLARPDTITVRLDWFNASDQDILWCDATCGAFVGNFNGATGANPENSTVIIPAGTTWNLYINLFDPHGANPTLVRARVSGIG